MSRFLLIPFLLGDLFKDIAKNLKNNNDILNLTKPDIVREVYEAYL